MKYKIMLLGVLVGFALSSSRAQAGFGDALKKAKGKIPEAPAVTTETKQGSTAGDSSNSPYLAHRESLIPYTGLGHTKKTKWFANVKEAKNFMGPKHDNCFAEPVKKVENKSNYKVWPSHDETKMQCVKLLDDADGKKACYFVEVSCKVQHPGQVEPKPGEWGAEYNRCEMEYESGWRFKTACPAAYSK